MTAPRRTRSGATSSFDSITRHPWRTLLAALALALLVLMLLWDWNWFKGPIERQVEASTGRAFTIAGDLEVDLGRVTTIRADGLQLGNAPWADEAVMASVDRLGLRIEVLPLLRGEVRIPEIRLDAPRLRLETGPEGEGNWVFGDDTGGDPPQLRELWINDGNLRFIDAAGGTDIEVDLASTQAQDQHTAPPISIEGGGSWAGNAFTIEGSAESPLDLQSTDTPYHLDVRAQAGATRAHARGNVTNPLQLERYDLQFALSGSNLEDLFPLVGVAMPPTPPYALDGRLRHAGDDTWHYDDFTGTVGDSDLAGSASVAVGGERPFLRANLVSKRLDFDDLAGFIGSAPQTGDAEASNAELEALAAKRAANPRVLPDTPYQLDKLRAMDADVRLRAQRINAPSLPLDDMNAHLKLDNGLLRLDPLDFGVADGNIQATIRLDAREKTIRTRADIAAQGLQLGQLFPDAELTDDAVGRIGGRMVISGTGNSIAQMLGSADGEIAVGMGKGRISNLLVELAGIDIYESLKYLIGKDRQVPIRCAFGDFAVEDGVMTARSLAFDTTDTIIIGEGTINLRDETLDLVLNPRPKDHSILTLRSPLVVDGTFKEPGFRPDLGRLGLRGAIAVALGTIAPPAALLATIEFGGGEDSGCGGEYAT